MAVEGENLGVATIYVTVDTTNMDAGITKSKLTLAGMGAEAQKQYDAMSVGQQKIAVNLARQIELMGKSTAQQKAYYAQQKLGGALGADLAKQALAQEQALTAAREEEATSAQKIIAAEAEARVAQQARYDAAMAQERALAAAYEAEAAARRAATAPVDTALTPVAAGGSAAKVGDPLVVQQIADYAALDAIMGKKAATTAEVAAAEAALDRLQAQGMLSNEELAESFAALDVVTAAETKSLQANSVAQVENAAATTVNSRTQYELGIMLGEVASGNINRLKRSGAALANSTGLLRALMTPTGLAIAGVIAALGSLVVAAGKGEAEFFNFNKTLIATGDYAGVTFAQYRQMAESLTGSGTSIGKAKDALSALAATGKFTGDQLGTAAQAVLNMSQLTGQSVDQAVASIVKLRDDPVKAIEALTDQYHFLSTATLQRIQQLQDQGNKEDAANLAEQTYADALRTRAAEMGKNLGTLQNVWHSLGTSASWAWDQMEGIGRPQTALGAMSDSYDKLLQARMSVQDRLAGKGTVMDFVNAPDSINGQNLANMTLQQQLAAIDAAMAKMRGDMQPLQDAANAAAQTKADAASLQQAGNEGIETLTKLGINLDGIKSKQDKVREAATALFKVWQAGGQLPKGVSFTGPIADVPVGSGWEAIKKQLLKGDPGIKAAQEQAKQAATALAAFQSQVNGLTNKSIGVDGDASLTKYVQGVAKLNDEFDKAIGKHVSLTQAQAVYDEGMKALNATLAKNQAAQAADQKALRDASDAKVAAYRAQIALQVEAVGMGDKEIQRAQQLAQLQSQYTDKIEQLRAKAARNPDQKSAIEVQIANETREMNAMVQVTEQGYSQMDAAQANWANGAEKAIANFHDQAADVAGQTAAVFNTAFSDMTNALMTFVTTGKLSFKSLVTDVLKGIAEMELKAEESKLFSLVGNMIASYFGGGVADNGSAGYAGYDGSATANSSNTAFGFSALGNVFAGPGIAAYENQIVAKPTFFARGGNVMGEAGPEAIIPLSRDSGGRLGIKSAGGGNTININTQVMVDQSGARSKTSSDSSDAAARQLGAMMEAKAKEVVGRAIQPGGILWRHGVGQAA